MNFIIEDTPRLQNCLNHIANLDPDKKWSVLIEEWKPNRRRAQENLWHKWVSIIAREKGYSPEEMKHLIKLEVFGATEFENKRTGETCYRVQSTAELSVEEYSHLINETERLAGDIVLPHPGDELITAFSS